MGRRNPNGRSSIYQGADGDWHGRVTMGIRDDGKPDRRHVQSKDRSTVVRRVKALEKERDNGHVRKPGQSWTVNAWLTHWLYNIAKDNLRVRAFEAYEGAVRVHLIPGLGAHRLNRLEPEHLERLYARLIRSGSKPSGVHQVHRTIRTALGEAVGRGHITTNPAALAKAPSLLDADEIEPYSVEEVQKILTAAGKHRNGARWAIALALGLRQGEVLGLQWKDVDLERGVLRVRRARQRPRYEHGCQPRCAKPRAGDCPHRRQVVSDVGPTKSKASRRAIGLPEELSSLLSAHRTMQDEERVEARQLWRNQDWVFTTTTGEPINPSTDYHAWKALLRDAGVRDGRLHDARHTAATVLLVLGITDRAAMGVMGWSSSAMAKRYQHLTDPVRHDIARRVGGLIWAAPDTPTEKSEGDSDDCG